MRGVLEVVILVAMAANLSWLNFRVLRPRFSGSLTCPHAYGLWEDCWINDGFHYIDTGAGERRVQKQINGQKRDCTMCGEREVRTVTTKTDA